MKQITQKELIELIKEKQENAKFTYESACKDYGYRPIEESRARLLTKERNKAYIDAYQDLICYINSVEIVPERIEANKGQFVGGNYPEEQIVTTIPKAKQEELGITQEDLKKWLEKAPITPLNEPKVEPLRNDRFIEFEKKMSNCVTYKDMVDAKSIMFIRFVKNNKEYSVEIWCAFGYITNKTFIEEARAIAYYNDLVAWWKYWKEN